MSALPLIAGGLIVGLERTVGKLALAGQIPPPYRCGIGPNRRAQERERTAAEFRGRLVDTERSARVIPARREKEPVMSRLIIAFALALAAFATNAQDATSGQSRAPAVANENGTQPFLFDGRMRGDGARQGAPADVHHPNAGAIVVQPKADQRGRER